MVLLTLLTVMELQYRNIDACFSFEYEIFDDDHDQPRLFHNIFLIQSQPCHGTNEADEEFGTWHSVRRNHNEASNEQKKNIFIFKIFLTKENESRLKQQYEWIL